MAFAKRRAIEITAYMAAILTLAACGAESDESMGVVNATATPRVVHSPTITANHESKPPTGKKELKISSETGHSASRSTPRPKSSPKKETVKDKQPDYNVTARFNADKPALMGFTVGAKLADVTERFGKPSDTYTMDDPQEPLQVYDFPGFSFGFDANKKVVFITVSSPDINPGLNGVRIGQTVQQAIEALGEPNTNTDYVIAYTAGGVVLKMDIDPSSDTITSIKLFAE
ncbi:MAG TPA: DUF4309 domain-containing protein [Bacilli bacterium]